MTIQTVSVDRSQSGTEDALGNIGPSDWLAVIAVALLLISTLFTSGCTTEETESTPTTTPTEATATKVPPTPTTTQVPPTATTTPVEPTPTDVTAQPTPTMGPIETNTVLGRMDAPVQIVIYSDFQCPGCERLHSSIEPDLIRLYVDTGKAGLEVRHLPALGAESLSATEAALCAADQGQFWEYRDAIFAAWRQVGRAAYSDAELQKAADELGLDTDRFDQCLATEATQPAITQTLQQAREDQITAVPTMFIDGRKVQGVSSLETYVRIIEELLAE